MVITLASSVLILSTFSQLSHTIDEPVHIACGLEWLQAHRYTYELQHPPLARIAAAAGRWLDGAHNVPQSSLFARAAAILSDSPSYQRTLSLARVCQLPFFLLLCWAVWSWARDLLSPQAALLALAITATTPVVLGHAGLATTDIALTATLLASLALLWRWATTPVEWRSTLVLAVAVAAGAASKLTFLIFFPLCGAILLLSAPPLGPRLSRYLHLLAALLAATLFLWGFYFFRLYPVPTGEGPVGLIQYFPGPIRDLIQRQPERLLPLGAYYRGLVEVDIHRFNGHYSYLFGEVRRFGWLHFFPVVFFFKTPLLFLASLVPAFFLLRLAPPSVRAPALCALVLMLSVLPSRINLGVRHILPIYPLCAIAIAAAWSTVAARRPRVCAAWATLLFTGQIAAIASVYPDHIAYFNAAAGPAPEQIRIDSDLDWGQNLIRVGQWVRQQHLAGPIGFSYYSTGTPTDHGINWRQIHPWRSSYGWLAISTTELKMPDDERPAGNTCDPWWWLEGHHPVHRIGGILIYHLPSPVPPSPCNF